LFRGSRKPKTPRPFDAQETGSRRWSSSREDNV